MCRIGPGQGRRKAPLRGARGSRFCRAEGRLARGTRALRAGQNWGNRASLRRSDPARYDRTPEEAYDLAWRLSSSGSASWHIPQSSIRSCGQRSNKAGTRARRRGRRKPAASQRAEHCNRPDAPRPPRLTHDPAGLECTGLVVLNLGDVAFIPCKGTIQSRCRNEARRLLQTVKIHGASLLTFVQRVIAPLHWVELEPAMPSLSSELSI